MATVNQVLVPLDREELAALTTAGLMGSARSKVWARIFEKANAALKTMRPPADVEAGEVLP